MMCPMVRGYIAQSVGYVESFLAEYKESFQAENISPSDSGSLNDFGEGAQPTT